MKVPFLDLKAQYRAIAREIDAALREVIEASAFSGGPFVAAFEEEFAAFCHCGHAIGVGSGTDALWLALRALGVGPGDEVVTVPNSFVATAEAITLCGATPTFVDVNERSCTMNPALLEGAITPKTKAVIPVHLYGQMADMDPIMETARRHRLLVIEDACQAHGAEYKGRRAGSIGDAGCFSFYPGKNLGAWGEAGGVTTNSALLAERIRMIRDHGQSARYYHRIPGVNSRMDGLQGALLSVKLKHLTEWNWARKKHAQLYRDLLDGANGLILPTEMGYGSHVYHLFPVRLRNREAVIAELTRREVGWGIHYPVPIHLQEAYNFLGLVRGSFPVAEKLAEESISLPMFPELDGEQIGAVAEAIGAVLGHTADRRAPAPELITTGAPPDPSVRRLHQRQQ
jgi:dTDP-4-amino-4,6-dideoxygalactose transaminase